MSELNDATWDPLIGTRIDERYTVLGVLGRGGMGVVYDGVHDELGRAVAIKVLNTAWAGDPNAVKRFLREARTASSFSHSNIVDVSDLGRLRDGRPYLVMPKITGTDLTTLLDECGPQPAKRVAQLLLGVASALDLIHAKGYVHRDIKPENLMFVVRDDGSETVMLLDFGIAALAMSNEPRLTAQGSVFGTPHYMPPEVWTGARPDACADVYSLATVAFELMTGVLPFQANDVMQMLAVKVAADPPNLSQVTGFRFPSALEQVMARGLARDPAERYASAGEFVSDLHAATQHAPVSWRAGVLRSTLRSAEHAVAGAPDEVAVSARTARTQARLSRASGRSVSAQAFMSTMSGASGRGSPRATIALPHKQPWLRIIAGLAGVLSLGSVLLFARTRPTPAHSTTTRSAARDSAAQAPAAPVSIPTTTAPVEKPSVPNSWTLPPESSRQPGASAGPRGPASSRRVASGDSSAMSATNRAFDSEAAREIHRNSWSAAASNGSAAPGAITSAPPPVPSEESATRSSAPEPAPEPAPHAVAPTAATSGEAQNALAPEEFEEGAQAPVVVVKQDQTPAAEPPASPPAAAPAPPPAAAPAPPPTPNATQLTQDATAALLRGEVFRAVSLLKNATRADPSHAIAWRTLGLALERSGDAGGAIDAYAHYLRLVPTGTQSDIVRQRMHALEKFR